MYDKDSSSARNEYRQSHEVKSDIPENPVVFEPEKQQDLPPVSLAPKRISVFNWFFTLFVCYIPVINVFTLLIWAFSGDTNPSKKSFAKAKLVWIFIELFILVIVSYFLYGYIKDIMQL